MLVLLALIFAATVGLALHFVLPYRVVRGAALAPLLAAAVAGVVYTSLTWIGLAEDNPWLWVVSLAIPAIVTWLVVAAISRARVARDARERVALRIG